MHYKYCNYFLKIKQFLFFKKICC